MDFNDIKNPLYYCFGSRFLKKNGEIDYEQLASELEEAEYYYAAMMFDCEDVGFNLRMQTFSPAKWIFEAEDYEVTEDDFQKFVKTDDFRKFATVVPEKVQAAIGALQMVDEQELKLHGIKKEDIDRITRDSLKIMTIVKAACKNPKMKA